MELRRREFIPAALAAGSGLRAATLEEIPLGITSDEIDDDLLTVARFLQRFHLRHAEIRNVWGKYNTVHPLEKIREAKGILDDHKIGVSILSTAFFKIPLPPDGPAGLGLLDNQWALLDSAMERAKIFGTDKIRIFAFTYRAGDKPDPGNYPRIYDLVRDAARRAKRRGFRLAVENVGESYVWSGAEAGNLLKAVKEDNLGLTWDPNNAGTTGEKPFPEGFSRLDPARIFHVHLRDYRKLPGGQYEWCAVGEGEFDNLGQLRALRKAGFRGSYTLETHWKSPKGKAHATEVSLRALLQIIENV
jgi:sugar phosphate isomerase/epimerase